MLRDRPEPEQPDGRRGGLGHGPRVLASQIIGALIALPTALAWLAIVSWNVADPSLSSAAAGPVRNWLGYPGAVVADLLVLTVGLGAIALLLPPLAWSALLVHGGRPGGLKLKAVLWPIAALATAGGFAAVPAPSSWPLYYGLGGILGDGLLRLATLAVGSLSTTIAVPASGLLLIAAGVTTLVLASGIPSALGLGASTVPADDAPPATPGLNGWTQQMQQALDRSRGLISRVSERASPSFGPQSLSARLPGAVGGFLAASPPPAAAGDNPGRAAAAMRPPADGHPPILSRRPPGDRLKPDWTPPQPLAAEGEVDGGRPRAFDASTDQLSRAIAERFAPKAATAKRGAALRVTGLVEAVARKACADYRKPSVNLLARPQPSRPVADQSPAVLKAHARVLEEALAEFGVTGAVNEIRPGPVVSTYFLTPASGINPARVAALADDIARAMSATSVRVTVDPSQPRLGIEVPNVRRLPIGLREVLDHRSFVSTSATLPIALGRAVDGEPVVFDLARVPGLLVAGQPGAGVSTVLHAILLSLVYRFSPEDCRFLLVDPGLVHLSAYDSVPHLLAPVATEPGGGLASLAWLAGEIEERRKKMALLGVRSIEMFNNRVRNALKLGERVSRTVQTGFDPLTGRAVLEREHLEFAPLPYVVVAIGELAEVVAASPGEIEAIAGRLAEAAEVTGIHLVAATEHPTADVLPKGLRSGLAARLALKVATRGESRAILEEAGAEQLLGEGDMLLIAAAGAPLRRVHGARIGDDELKAVMDAVRAHGPPAFVKGLAGDADARASPSPTSTGPKAATAPGRSELIARASEIVLGERRVSISLLQRRLSISYAMANELVADLEAAGVVGPSERGGARRVLGAPVS
jgi:S-DNA-T family DNA segregation ATPase FtsK/SpoIIIE